MMQTSMRLLFWGLVIVLIDVRLGQLDVLHDVVGYALIYVALHELASRHCAFQYAKPFALAGGLMTVVAMVAPTPQWITGVPAAVSEFLIGWWICTGILSLSISEGHAELAEMARVRRKWYVIAGAMALTVSTLALLPPFPQLTALLAVPVAIFEIFVMALVLHLIWRAGNGPTPQFPAAGAVP